MYYDELLSLCGYEPEDIERERPRIEKAFEKLEFTPEDINRGEKRVRQYYDIELTSMRKILGLWLQSLIDLVLAREEREKIIYCSMPPFSQVMNAMAMSSREIYVIPVDILLSHTVGAIFDKLNPLFEAAEGDLVPTGANFCGGITAKLGAINKGVIPVPDLLVSTGFVCDQTPKIDEVIGERYGIPVAYVDCTHDEIEENWPRVSERRLKYIMQEARDALAKFQEVTGHTITDELAERANSRAVDLIRSCGEVLELVRNADPLPISFADSGTAVRLMIAVNTTTLYKDLDGLTNLLYKEIEHRVAGGKGVLPKGAPRIAINMLWSQPDPVKLIESTDLAILTDMADGLVATEPERAIGERKDFWECSAELVLRNCGIKFAKRMSQVCKEAGLDGVIITYPVGCRDLCIEPIKGKELITKDLGIPVLLLEMDHVDTRSYSPEAMRNRIEPFAEMLKNAKAR